ncbi:MAG: hypothetical protein AAB491_02885 [Patescibacteria group bacterium]
MNKDLFFLIIGLIIVGGIFSVANAINPFDITYPISELGNCASQEECKAYCDNSDNEVSCVNWAAGKGFVDKKEAEKIKEKANRKGPGNCSSYGECENYCRNPEHIEECMNFAVEDGNISREEADFIIQRIKMYGGPDGQKSPGPRRGPQGPKIDEAKAKQVLESKGGGPGGCKGMEECAAYCEDFNHGEECMNFAVENGFMPPEEEQRIRKMMTMAGPGGCKGPQECDVFCSKDENRDECFRFAKESGMMPPEEIQMMEREMGIVKKLEQRGGPGGCRGPSECEEFCRNSENLETCMNFASQNGMMRKDEAEMRMQEMRQMQTQMQVIDQDRERFMRMGPPPGFEGFQPPQGFMPPPGGYQPPPEGMMPFPPPTGKFEEQQFPGQGELFQEGQPPPGVPWMEQFKEQPQQGEFMMPPEGFRPPDGYMPPPGGYQPPPEGYIAPMPPSLPPSESAPSEQSPPSSYKQNSLFGIIFGPFLDIFR